MVRDKAVSVPPGSIITDEACGCVGRITDRVGHPDFGVGTAIQVKWQQYCSFHTDRWGIGQGVIVTYDPLVSALDEAFDAEED